MDTLGLNRADRRLYQDGLVDDHERQVTFAVTDLDHGRIAALPQHVTDGQVTIRKVGIDSAATQSTRVLTASFLDPKTSINFDPHSPADEALWTNRMIRVTDRRYIPGLGWVAARPFIGPVVNYERTGNMVKVTCYGKERLAQIELGETRKWNHGTKVVKVIQDLMEAAGETKFDLPAYDRELPHDLSLSAKAIIWVQAQKLARSIDKHLFYPGSGRLRMRTLPEDPVFRFTTGEGGSVLGELTTAYNLDDFHNVIIVTGRKPRGAKQRVSGRAIPRQAHPLSPHSMIRGDVPLKFVLRKNNPQLRTKAACHKLAHRLLQEEIVRATTARFDALPIPHLDEGDMCVVEVEDVGNIRFRLSEFSIPLVATNAAVMPVGYRKRTSRW